MPSIDHDRLLVEGGATYVNALINEMGHASRLRRNRKRLNMVRLLIEKGANVNARRGRGTSVLHDALKRDDQELVEFLIAKGATDQEGEESNTEGDKRCRAGTDDDGNGSNDGN